MTSQENKIGQIYILPRAIRTVARAVALQSYGVINLAPRNFLEAVNRLVCKDSDYGIKVATSAEGLVLELSLIIEYGLRIKSVSDSVAESVKFNVEKTMGIPVQRVDVHVRGLRISNPD